MQWSDLENWTKDFYSKNKKTILLVLALIIGILIFLDRTFFSERITGVLEGFDFVMLGLFLIFLLIAIGYALVHALFHVAAGLSLIIFLAQSYCGAVTHFATSDNALKGLIAMSLIYISIDFLYVLYKGLTKTFGSLKELRWDIWKVLLFLVIITLTGLLIWDVYLVINPIISGICVYHR